MKRFTILVTALSILTLSSPAISSDGHSGHETSSGNTSSKAPGSFSHKAVVDGIRTEFQIMSLQEMNMKDPNGATHHVMLRLFNDEMNHQIQDIVGKVKVISPSGKEQTATLKDYNGIYAANFTFEEKGKYGVICLFKEKGNKHLVKFWYHHS